MKVIYGIGKAKHHFRDIVLVIGIFDGLHRGHQILIRSALRRARVLKCKMVVLTFSPHPMLVLHPEKSFHKITSLAHRLKLLSCMGVDACIVGKFTQKFSLISPAVFVKRYLCGILHVKEVFIGEDFRFGQNRRGEVTWLYELGERYGFRVHIMKDILKGHAKISSTQIRRFVARGDLTRAENLMGRRFAVMGRVEKGEGRGAWLGFRTVNIYPDQYQLLPPTGVYAVKVAIGNKCYPGMANLGWRKTFSSTRKQINIETHLFDLKRNLYGKEIVIEFYKRIRKEKQFPDTLRLVEQIQKDEQAIRKYFSF